MPKIRPQEVREMVLRLVNAGKFYTEVSHLTGGGRASVSPWMRRYKATGSLEAKPIGGGRTRSLSGVPDN